MSPYYFPHVVRNADGSLTGYFDWRPKDADEAIVTARSTDNGKDWTYEGQALEQNPGYCPNADINDDGQGHPQRSDDRRLDLPLHAAARRGRQHRRGAPRAHAVDPVGHESAGRSPATEKVGLDPDSFATAADSVSHAAASTISVQATHSADLTNGAAGSPEELVPGPFVDLTQTPTPTAASIITCTGRDGHHPDRAAPRRRAPRSAWPPATYRAGRSPRFSISGPSAIPPGPNRHRHGRTPAACLRCHVTPVDTLTMTIFNNNAPNRVYVDGVAAFCSQANASPTTKIEDCTTGNGGTTINPTPSATP